MPPPLAYLITWTTYGTWLHGDDRGSADRLAPRDPGLPYLAPDRARARFEREELKSDPVIFSREARRLVDRVIREHCAFRGWTIHALNVRTNHVHLVVTAPVPPEKIMGECKAWASRRMRETSLLDASKPKLWTRHGSTRYLNDEASVDGAIRYVRDGQ